MHRGLEEERLEVLAGYCITDTGTNPILDAISHLAAYVCQVSVSIVTLNDRDKQWFKAKVGIDIGETLRSESFCNEIIKNGDFYQIKDAFIDDQFCDHPLVIGEPHFRFYAGYPLVSPEGYIIGSLCVLDSSPGFLTKPQIMMLRSLSQLVMARFEATRLQIDLIDNINYLKSSFGENVKTLEAPIHMLLGVNSMLQEGRLDRNLDSTTLHVLNETSDTVYKNFNKLQKKVYESNNIVHSEVEVAFNLLDLIQHSMMSVIKNPLKWKINYDVEIGERLIGVPNSLRRLLKVALIDFKLSNENILEANVEILSDNSNMITIEISLLSNEKFSFSEKSILLMKQLSSKSNISVNKRSDGVSLKIALRKPLDKRGLSYTELEGLKVLLVDDVELNRRIGANYLQHLGIDCDLAHNGLDALHMIQSNTYDVILMDIIMPGWDGFYTIQKIKSVDDGKYKKLPVVVLTASINMDDELMLKHDIAGYISKPFNPDEMQFLLLKVLSKSSWIY